jgi:hypothetical protein
MKYHKPYHNELVKRTKVLLKPLVDEAVEKGERSEYIAHVMQDAIDQLVAERHR